MSVLYRPATADDLQPAMEAVAESLNDLERRHGFDGVSGPIDTTFAAFSLRDDPTGLWVAEDNGEIVGFGFSWHSDRLWFLADLFVRPRLQQGGIGAGLLNRTLQQARQHDAAHHALITFAYNRVSLGLYMRQNMFPRLPLYELAGAAAPLRNQAPTDNLKFDDISADVSAAGALESIDQAALGLSRAKHHRFSLLDPKTRSLLFRGGDGTALGYAYISSAGHAGPIAVNQPEFMARAVRTALTVAAGMDAKNVSVFLPGCCDEALAIALGNGLRLGRTMMLLSSKPFGNWTCYAPRGPGFM